LDPAGPVVAGLAQQHDITRCVRLDVVRELHAVQVRHSLESGELFSRSTRRADVLSVLKVEIWVVELFAAFEFELLLFRVAEVELDD